MCFYITATLPEGSQLENLGSIFNKYEMEFSKIHNNKVKSQLRPKELYFRATKSYCDCDSILGSLNQQQEYQKLYDSKKVKTLKKKKWSEERIKNWIEDKLKNKDPKKRNKLTPIEIEKKLNRWTKFIQEILNNKTVSRIGIIKHWYSGGLEDEQIIIKKTIKIPLNQITHELLLNLPEDTLYEFFPNYNY